MSNRAGNPVERPSPRDTPLLRRAVAMLALAGGLLAGCATSSVQDSEGRVFVHGYSPQGCTLYNKEAIAEDHPDVSAFTGVFECRDEMSDPRVTGEVDWTLDPAYVYYMIDPQTGRMEASPVLTPDQGGGTWRGTGFGVDLWTDGGLSTVVYNEYLGDGEYEGLVYRQWLSQQPDSEGYEIIGYIEATE